MSPGTPSPALTGVHVLMVSGSSPRAEGPGLNALAVHLESVSAEVSVLPEGSLLTDVLGRRVVGRPDLVVAILPGRGPSRAAVRIAERLGRPLLALLTADDPPSWGEDTTLRHARLVGVSNDSLRERAAAAGVPPGRVRLWPALTQSALPDFELMVRAALDPVAEPVTDRAAPPEVDRGEGATVSIPDRPAAEAARGTAVDPVFDLDAAPPPTSATARTRSAATPTAKSAHTA